MGALVPTTDIHTMPREMRISHEGWKICAEAKLLCCRGGRFTPTVKSAGLPVHPELRCLLPGGDLRGVGCLGLLLATLYLSNSRAKVLEMVRQVKEKKVALYLQKLQHRRRKICTIGIPSSLSCRGFPWENSGLGDCDLSPRG